MKKSIFLFSLVIGFSTLFLFNSCSKEEIQSNAKTANNDGNVSLLGSSNCDKPFYEITSYSDGAHLIENFLYVEKDYDQVNQLNTKESYYNHYNSYNPINVTATAIFDLHGQKYRDLGHEGYIDYVTSEGIISHELSDYFKGFRTNFVNFINTNNPNYEDYKIFLENKGVELESNLTLCDYEKYVAKVYHVLLLGVGKYIYNNHYSISMGQNILDQRSSCETLSQQLLCGTGGVIAGTIVGVVVGVFDWAKSIFTGKKDGKDVELIKALYQVYKIGTDMWKTGVSFYTWCCDALYGEEIAECGDPTGCWYNELGCNYYNINVVGPGLYTITNWNNDNTNPSTAITPTPRLNVSIPDINKVSIIQGNVLCTDENGNSNKNFAFKRQIGGSQPFPIPLWGNSPPANAIKNQSYQISVLNPPTNGSFYTMSLSTSWGYNFTLITGGMFTFTGYVSGNYWLEVTYTHICTGETHKTGQWVSVLN